MPGKGWGQITEGFESGVPTSYPTTQTSYTFGSGSWSLLNVLQNSTNKHSGSYCAQIKSASGANATTPSLNTCGTVTFWCKSGTTGSNGLKIQKSISGGAFTDVQTFTITTTNTQYTCIVSDNSADVKIRFLNMNVQTLYLDDVSATTNVTPDIVLDNNGTPIAAGNINQGTSAVVLQKIQLGVTTANATLTGITCTTAGSYVSADITNLKVRYSTDAALDAGDVTLSTFTTPGVAGSKTFPTFTAQSIASGATGYIFITADVAAGATHNNTISIDAIATSNLTFASGNKTGSTTAGGLQTIKDVTAPTISTYSPTDGNTSVTLDQDLVLTFNETVQAGTAGNIIIYNSDGSTFESIPYNDGRITFATNTVTINPTGTFLTGADYYVQIPATAIRDIAGNNYAGISTPTTWNFTTVAPAVTNVTSTTADGTYGPGSVINVSVIFSDIIIVTGPPRVQLETGTTDHYATYSGGSGTTTLSFEYTVQTTDETADLNYKATSSLGLNTGTINSPGGITASLILPALASGNSLAGQKAIVIDGVSPTVNSYGPTDGNSSVSINQNLILTFNENVKVGTSGAIVIYNSDASVFETIPYDDSRITFSTNTLTINPSGTFSYSSDYYVQISSNAIKDMYDNSYVGINDATTWNFSTICGPISSFPWTENFDGVTISAFPNCWLKENGDWVATNNANSTYDADAHSGTQFLRESYSATNEYIWTPGFALTSGTSYDFSFWWAGDTYSGWTGDIFYNTNQISTGATQIGSSFVASGIPTTKTYVKLLNTFVAPTTGIYYFAIRVNATSTPWYLSFDDFTLELSPSCITPTAVTSSTVTATTATISWTAATPAPVNGYQYEVRTSGVAGSGATGLTTSSSTAAGVVTANITGLAAASTYYVYIRSACSGVDFSAWTSSYSFTTATPTITVGSVTAFGNQTVNTTSVEKSYVVSGTNLISDVTITPPTGYEISIGSGGSFVATNPVTLNPTSGTLASTTIYLRFKPVAVQSFNGNITHTATSAVSKIVALSGSGTAPTNPATFTATANSSSQINLSSTANTNGNNIVVVFNGTGSFTTPSNEVAPGGIGASLAGGTIWYQGTAASLTNHTGLEANTAYYYKAFSYDGANFYSAGSTANAITNNLPAPTATGATAVTSTSFTATWGAVSGASSGYLLDVSTSGTFSSSGPVLLNEGFETGLTGGYTTGNLTLGTGVWSFIDAGLKVTGAGLFNSGLAASQMKANSGTITSPALNSIGTVTFYAKANSGTTVMTIKKIVNAVTSTVTTRTVTNTWAQYTVDINENSIGVQIVFAIGSTYGYIDDISIGYTGTAPSFVSGYNAKAISGQSTTNSDVTGLSPNTTFYYHLRAVGGASTSANSGTITVTTGQPYQSQVNGGNWNTPATWSPNGTPTSIDDVTIKNTFPVIVDAQLASPAACANLTIENSSSLTISPNKALTVGLAITNGAGNTGLVIQSNSSGTGSLKTSSSPSATVERYITGVAEAWHLLSSPVADQEISGSFIPSGTYADGSGYDFYAWDEPSETWLNQKVAGNGISTFIPAKGYLVAYQDANPTKTFAGTLNTAAQSFPMTISGTGTYAKTNLAGNPYPSSMDWKSLSGWDKSNLQVFGEGHVMSSWIESKDNYGVYSDASLTDNGTNGVTRYIAPMQGFFVFAESAGNLTFDNNTRVHNSQSFLKSADAEQPFRLMVTAPDNKGSDEISLEFGHSTSEGGAAKMFSFVATAPSLFTPKSGIDYSISFLTSVSDNPVIPVSFKAGTDGEYTLSANMQYPANTSVFLTDHKLAVTQNLADNPVYTFTASPGDDAGRFELRFTDFTSVPASSKQETFSVYQDNGSLRISSPQSGNAEIRVVNMLGQVVLRGSTNGRSITTLNAGSLQNGVYIVSLVGNGKVVSRKVVVSK